MEETEPPIPTSRVAANVYVKGCPSRVVLARIGEKWSMLALITLHGQPLRFGALMRRLEGVSQKMLTEKLRGLERDGLISRRVYMEMPLRVEYALTELGESLVPIMLSVRNWAESHLTTIAAHQSDYDRRQQDDVADAA